MSLLQVIMAYPAFNTKGSLLPQILKLEEHFIQYERLSGSKLPADMKAAVLLRAVGGQMKVHLNLTLNEGSSYQKIREAILAFDTATTRWNESAAISFTTSSPMTQTVDQGGLMPMEVDRLQKGDDKKGKGKGKEMKGKGKFKEDKGKGMTKMPKGGAKEGKGKSKEAKQCKGKGTGGDVCWTCGKLGHHSKDCWRVRQVEAPPATSISSSGNTTSPSTTATNVTGGGDSQGTALKTVRRVSQPLIFDLRDESSEDSGAIRVLTALPEAEMAVDGVDFFHIDTDDESDEKSMLISTVREGDEFGSTSPHEDDEGAAVAIIVEYCRFRGRCFTVSWTFDEQG